LINRSLSHRAEPPDSRTGDAAQRLGPMPRQSLSLDHPGGWSRIEPIATTSLRSMVPRAIVSTGPAARRALGQLWHRGRAPERWTRRRCRSAAILVFAACTLLGVAGAGSATLRFRADEWVTECGGSLATDCSITVPFWQTGDDGKGSFALVVMLETGNIGIVGQPAPVRAVLRIDRNPPIECRATRYCIFPTAQSLSAVRELAVGSLVLIDVFTTRAHFSFSLTPKGYQAGVAQIRAWGYRISGD
jgi:hypothetical protein